MSSPAPAPALMELAPVFQMPAAPPPPPPPPPPSPPPASEGRTKSLRQLDNDCKEADARSRRTQAEYLRRTKEVENLGLDVVHVNEEVKNLETVLADLRSQFDAERARLDK